MHSSRMRTAHLLPVSPSMLCSGRCLPMGCLPAQRDVCPGGYLPGGCLPAWVMSACLGGVCLPGGCLPRGCLPGRLSTEGGVCPGVSVWGVSACLVGGVCPGVSAQGVSKHAMGQTPPLPVDRQTPLKI